MAFSDFQTIEQVLRHHPLLVIQERFLPAVRLAPPDWFLENLNFSLEKQALLESEMFFRENFIFPFLHYVWRQHSSLKLWTNHAIRYDDHFYGEPDYLIAAPPTAPARSLLGLPLLAVFEAKKQDFEAGWGQCLAAMIACQQMNHNVAVAIYGIVSTGILWEFGKLAGDRFIKHPISYSISDPSQVLGRVDFFFAECEAQLAPVSAVIS